MRKFKVYVEVEIEAINKDNAASLGIDWFQNPTNLETAEYTVLASIDDNKPHLPSVFRYNHRKEALKFKGTWRSVSPLVGGSSTLSDSVNFNAWKP
jgi:hypothetical protein